MSIVSMLRNGYARHADGTFRKHADFDFAESRAGLKRVLVRDSSGRLLRCKAPWKVDAHKNAQST